MWPHLSSTLSYAYAREAQVLPRPDAQASSCTQKTRLVPELVGLLCMAFHIAAGQVLSSPGIFVAAIAFVQSTPDRNSQNCK